MNTISALTEAVKSFQQGDPHEMAERCGGYYDVGKKKMLLKYFNQEVEAVWPAGEVSGSTIALETNDKVIILQYILTACTVKSREKWISFFQLPDGPNHHQPFLLEATQPLAAHFGEDIDHFKKVCADFGGVEVNLGEAGFVIPALPRVPLAVCLWSGDDEFPANANILFDSSAPLHLTTAALWVLGIELSRKLRGANGQQFCNSGR